MHPLTLVGGKRTCVVVAWQRLHLNKLIARLESIDFLAPHSYKQLFKQMVHRLTSGKRSLIPLIHEEGKQ